MFKDVFVVVRPRPPKVQSWQVPQQTALQDLAFFLQVVALMLAAAAALNLGGKGGEQQHKQNGCGFYFADTGIREEVETICQQRKDNEKKIQELCTTRPEHT